MRRILLPLMLFMLAATVRAEELIMVRAPRSFPEAMTALQQSIQDHGYQLARVQRVDVGLTSSGFKTAEYRVVFFGKTKEMQELAADHPELMPYLPLKIVIFAEGESTLVLTNSPVVLGTFFKDAALQRRFQHWEKDVRSILDQVSR
jgi:uncharacterized protein (DUF302 family)